ncbi:uncharacterized protein LTR77_002253 [Saxophila tyrrhenica]|uniref:Uncharacterized protein n=1 Tax=Saxophila tyrrhenica TaxID=1690608 RepID=A0AAV9PHZ9_9PEZI|nr:hypothetical protein LTR77_002253 [Saxophila tyrrhenica]
MARFQWLQVIAALVLWISKAAASDISAGSEPYVWCYNCGNGVTRLDAGIAVGHACNYYMNRMMSKDDDTAPGLRFTYLWSAYTHITLSVIPQWFQPGCTSDTNDFMFDFDRCYYSFMAPIDDCNTGGVNGKKGGWYMYYCAAIMTNTAPEECPGGYIVGKSSRITAALDADATSTIETFTYHASEEEHQAARAALLGSPEFADECAEHEFTTADDAEPTDEADAGDKLPAPAPASEPEPLANIEKRDTTTTCFGPASSTMECYGIDRSLA